MPRAVILAGTGAVGWATARRLLAGGWQVVVTGRVPEHAPPGLAELGGRFLRSDRHDPADLAGSLAGGADLVVDCACYTAGHASDLVPLLGDVTSAVMISSKAVYVDDEGRHSNSDDPPQFAGPIGEDQPTLRPDDAGYDTREGYGANKVAAETVLLDSGRPVTVLRLSKVHGAWARRPREWVFVKRVLDGRRAVFLAGEGAGADHPSAALNVAALVEAVARRPARRVLNCADPDCPDARHICRVVAAHLGHTWKEVLVPPGEHEGLGAHPWDARPPIVLDTTAAAALGYEPVGDYAATVVDELDWLVACSRDERGRRLLPADDDPFFAPLLDYRLEADYLERRRDGRPAREPADSRQPPGPPRSA